MRKVKNRNGTLALMLCLAGSVLLYTEAIDAQTVCYAEEEIDTDFVAEEGSTANDNNEVRAQIFLDNENTEIFGDGAALSENVVTISESGTYLISGSMWNGQICVDAEEQSSVVLELDDVDITNESDSAIYVKKAGHTQLMLGDGTYNRICSGADTGAQASEGTVAEDAKGGAVYSKDDLEVCGNGTLEVKGFINNGIHCADNLTISGGELNVDAVNHGIKGKDSLTINSGTITVTSGKDAVHSDGAVSITGGNTVIQARDDGIHADTELTISGGSIDVQTAYEGLEGNQITITDGQIRVKASDDGINAYGGTDAFGAAGFFNSGSDEEEDKDIPEEDPVLRITGGNIYIDSQGDGLDSNYDLFVDGGVIVIDGPERGADGSIDAGLENEGECTINGGTVLAIGASGMLETFGSNSTQCSFCYTLERTHEAGSQITITDESGITMMEYTSQKSFSSIIMSAPELELGATYHITVDDEIGEVTLDEISTENSIWSFGAQGAMGRRPFDGQSEDTFENEPMEVPEEGQNEVPEDSQMEAPEDGQRGKPFGGQMFDQFDEDTLEQFREHIEERFDGEMREPMDGQNGEPFDGQMEGPNGDNRGEPFDMPMDDTFN